MVGPVRRAHAARFVAFGAVALLAAAGLTRGDILTKINEQVVLSLEVIKAAQAAYETKPEPTLVEVQRNRRVSLYILKP